MFTRSGKRDVYAFIKQQLNDPLFTELRALKIMRSFLIHPPEANDMCVIFLSILRLSLPDRNAIPHRMQLLFATSPFLLRVSLDELAALMRARLGRAGDAQLPDVKEKQESQASLGRQTQAPARQ
jgi:hypothetical protein